MLDKVKIEDLLVQATNIISKAEAQEENNRKKGNSLNFMTATGIQYKEIRHSAFLAALLDPDGDHGQGDVLLKSFCDQFAPSLELDCKNAEVKTEAPGNNSDRLDILVETKTGPWLAIENKVWADEGTDQIKRYQIYLSKKAPESKIIFLSPSGADPITADKTSDIEWVPVSYTALSDWLLTIIEQGSATKIPQNSAVYMLIKQYAEICSQIGGHPMETNSTEFETLISENLKEAMHVEVKTRQVREKIFNDFWIKGVLDRLEKELKSEEWHAFDGVPSGGRKIKQPRSVITIAPQISLYDSSLTLYCVAIEIQTMDIGIIRCGENISHDETISQNLDRTLGKQKKTPQWPWYRHIGPEFYSFRVSDFDAILSIHNDKEQLAKNIVGALVVILDKTKDTLQAFNGPLILAYPFDTHTH